MAKRLTRHNGRAGKSGVYKSTHNDRTFDTERAGHIDSERIQQNIYWDCFRGATYPVQQDGEVSFADVERAFEFHHIGASAARDGHSCFLRMCMIHKVMY